MLIENNKMYGKKLKNKLTHFIYVWGIFCETYYQTLSKYLTSAYFVHWIGIILIDIYDEYKDLTPNSQKIKETCK